VGRSGAAFLVSCLLSSATAVSAEPERPCPSCVHGMARAEGPVAGAADYLCRFCEVAVHVKPDGRETVSYRVAGERRVFDLLGDARLRFPLPGGPEAPEDVIVPVSLAAAPQAGHPVKLPGHPVGLPAHPVSVPTAAPVNLPNHPVALPDHPVGLPAHAVKRPGHPVALPAHAVKLPSHAVRRPAAPVRLPGHPVRLPGHPVGRIVTIARVEPAAVEEAATPTVVPPTETCEVVVEATQQSSRFFSDRPLMSVLRGSR
jgi:hypothetical protein